jgi:4,5-dihydroxyphthalate decarboxylase
MPLKASLSSYPHTAALLDGTVKPSGFEVEYLDVGGAVGGFRKMMRGTELDFCEIGVTTYLSGWDYRNEITAIPAHVACGFPFASIMINTAAGVDEPKDLEGKRVACRTYTVTSVVWARGAIQDLFDVDLDSITWVVNDEEHAAEFVWPKNVEYQKGADLSAMVASGEVAAGFAVFRGEAEHVRPLFPDIESIEKEWFAHSRVFPINHSIALPRTLSEADPDLAGHLYRYFVEGKQVFLDKLDRGGELSASEQALARRRALLGPDPVPYGIEAARPTLEALLRYCYEQHITHEHLGVEEIFAAGSA